MERQRNAGTALPRGMFVPDFAFAPSGLRATGCYRNFAFSNELVTSHAVIISLGVTYPDPLYGGAFRRRLVGGERERHLRATEDATIVPGPCSGSLAGH